MCTCKTRAKHIENVTLVTLQDLQFWALKPDQTPYRNQTNNNTTKKKHYMPANPVALGPPKTPEP